MAPIPANYNELKELAKSVAQSRPELLNEIKQHQFTFTDYLEQRIDSAYEDADIDAIATLARLKQRIDDALEQYTKSTTEMYAHRLERDVLTYACGDTAAPNRELFNEVENLVADSSAAQVNDAKKLLAYYGMLETYLSGKEPTYDQDLDLIVYNGFSGLIGANELAAARNELTAQEVELHGEFGPAPPMTTKGATLILDTTLPDGEGLNLDDAPQQLRSGRYDKWANDAFRNMLKGVYTDAELDELAAAGKDPMDGVFINGTPLSAAIKGSSIYVNGANKKEQLARCGAELILQGNKKLSVVRYEKGEDGEFALSDKASTAKVKPNIEEKFSLWRSIKRFFGIEKSFEERKKAISISKLTDEEAADRIAENVSIVNSQKVIRNTNNHIKATDQKYFHDELPEGIDPKRLGRYYDVDLGKHQNLLSHMSKIENRVGLLNAYMLSRGMSMSDILSDDPALDEIKRGLTADLLNKFKVDTLDEYYEKNRDSYPNKFKCAEEYKNTYITEKANELTKFYTDTLYPAVEAQTRNIKEMRVDRIKSMIDNYEVIQTISDMGKALVNTTENIPYTADASHTKNMQDMHSKAQGLSNFDVVNTHVKNVISAHKMPNISFSLNRDDGILGGNTERRINKAYKDFNNTIASRAAVEYSLPHIENLCGSNIIPKCEDLQRLSTFKNKMNDAVDYIKELTNTTPPEQMQIHAVNVGRGHLPIPPDIEDYFLMTFEKDAVIQRRNPQYQNNPQTLKSEFESNFIDDESVMYHGTLENDKPIKYNGRSM